MFKKDLSKLTSWELKTVEIVSALIEETIIEDDIIEEIGDCENLSVVPNYKKSAAVLNKYSENVVALSDEWFIIYKISDEAMIELMEINCFHQYGSGFVYEYENDENNQKTSEKKFTFTESELIEFLSKNMKLAIDEDHEYCRSLFTVKLQLKQSEDWTTISSVDIVVSK